MVKRLAPWLWLGLMAVACDYEIDGDLCTRDAHCGAGEVCAVNNSCFTCNEPFCPPSQRCDDDGDCDDEEACADDGVCRTACLVDDQCRSGSCLYSGWCRASFGEPCVTGFSTLLVCPGECIDTDAALETVPAYCTRSCSVDECPLGYACRGDLCRVLAAP